MKKEIRMVACNELQIEAYRFVGIERPFPNHFHEYYVIGCVEAGERMLSCKGNKYRIGKGDIILLNPGDNHACVQSDGGVFDYWGFNISKSAMLKLVEKGAESSKLPGFSKNIICDDDIACRLHALHEQIMSAPVDSWKESLSLLVLELLQNYGQAFEIGEENCSPGIKSACEFIRQHFHERIYLDQICCYSGLSKSTLLRAFTREKGVTPYQYLESLRIDEAKVLLCKGVQPVDAAMQMGFADQSHFTNYFTSFIGFSPSAYHNRFFDKETERNGA